MAEADGHVNLFKNLEENLKLVIEQVRDGQCTKISSENFDPDIYWAHLGAVFKALSMEGTKFSLAFCKAPFPGAKECERMVGNMEKTVLELVSVFYSLPKTQGTCLRRILRRGVLHVMVSVLSLVSTLASTDLRPSERRQATGVVWEDTSNYSTLPKNNIEALMQTLDQTHSLVTDALQETEEIAVNDGKLVVLLGDEEFEEHEEEASGDNTQCWTDKEREMVGPVKGLIKTAVKMLNKARQASRARAQCDSDERVAQLDDLSDCAERLSPAVDNLTSCLYAPVDHITVRNNATTLSDVITNMLTVLRHSHVTEDKDGQWVDFLQKASTHNLTTLLHLLNK